MQSTSSVSQSFSSCNFLGSIGVNTIISSDENLDHQQIYITNKKPKRCWKGLLCCSAPKCCTANIHRSRSIQKQPRHNTRYKPTRSRSSSPPFLPPHALPPKYVGGNMVIICICGEKNTILSIKPAGGFSDNYSFFRTVYDECRIRFNNKQNLFIVLEL